MEAGPLNVEQHDPGNPREVFRLLWRRRWILLVCILLIPAATYLYSEQLTKSYQSSTVLQIQATADAASVLGGTSTGTGGGNASVAALAQTSGVANEAARIMGAPKGALPGTITAVADEDTGFITLTGTAGSGKAAAAIADAAAKALDTTREKAGIERADRAIAGVRRDLRELSKNPSDATERQQLSQQLQQLRALRAAQGNNATVIEPAAVPSAPVSPNPRRNAILAFVLSILAGVALVILVDRMDRRLRDADEVERLVGVPLLAVISREAFPGGRPSKRHSEAFQTLRDSLTYFNVDEAMTILAVTSPLKGEGKTTVATNLAVSLARANKRVILVDADLRRPQVGTRMGVDESRGLSSVLLGADLQATLREVPPFGARLRILPAGPTPPNPSELIGSKRMSALLAELTELADVVVIDTTPLLVVSDAFPLLEQVSGTVGVARLDQTPREAVQRMVEITTTAGGRVFGMVATGAKGTSFRSYDDGYYENDQPIVGVTPANVDNGSTPVESVSGDADPEPSYPTAEANPEPGSGRDGPTESPGGSEGRAESAHNRKRRRWPRRRSGAEVGDAREGSREAEGPDEEAASSQEVAGAHAASPELDAIDDEPDAEAEQPLELPDEPDAGTDEPDAGADEPDIEAEESPVR